MSIEEQFKTFWFIGNNNEYLNCSTGSLFLNQKDRQKYQQNTPSSFSSPLPTDDYKFIC